MPLIPPLPSLRLEFLRVSSYRFRRDVAMLGRVGAGWGAFLCTAADKKLISVAKPGNELPGGGKLTSAEAIGRNSIRIGEDGSVLFAGVLDNGAGPPRPRGASFRGVVLEVTFELIRLG